MKYVVVTGGVVSGLGKGVTASSLGVVLKGCGLRVTSIKIDPYLNADAGTMSPFEHGEVFVLDDGGEVDLDLGNYERFLDVTLKRDNNITTGRVYQSVIDKERRGDFLGKTVQVVPHITNAIQDWIEKVAKVPVDGRDGEPDVCVIELGGTVGDIESMPFFEAISQFHDRVGSENICLVHVSLVPVLGVVGEQKSKCTQHSVRELRALGLTPYLLACRSAKPLEVATKDKIAQFCHVPTEHVLSVYDVSNIWHIPLILREQNAHLAVLKKFNLFKSGVPRPKLEKWANMAEGCDRLSIPVKIAMVGKYTGLSDAYLSVIKWVSAADLEDNAKDESPEVHAAAWKVLKNSDGVLVPGGFGDRGVQGKILAAKYARESRVPFLGICLGLQIAVIEFARSVLGLKEANSTEFDQATPYPCVVSMPEISKTHMGGTMRLGSRRTFLNSLDCLTAKLYQHAEYIDERHRHRYEVNPDMVDELEAAGLRFVGKDETGRRMEIMEYPEHPYYVAVQFHPEFKSRPVKPSAVFLGLIMASSGQLDAYLRDGENVRAAANGHCKVELVANGHVQVVANGHAKEAANGHVKEAANGHAKEAANGHAKKATNGHAKNAANGHTKDAANGYVKDAANGRLKGAPNRRVQASVNGLGEDATNGHVESAANGRVECCCKGSCGTCGKRTWEGLGKCCRISVDHATHHCTSVISKSRKVESDMTRIIQ